ncbi:unnamed protein product [Closterium sp. NIES-65]|nr:unnamed protein product [Closterium sp. NIES-65]
MRVCLLIAVVALLLASRAGAKKPRVDAAAAGGAGADIIVAKDGTGQYTTIQEAFTAARSGNRNRFFVIFIKAGIYEEQPTLPANLRFIGLVGERAGSGVKITSSGAAGDSSLDECATFRLLASDVVISNIIFENAHGPGEQGGDEDQAVAMKVAGTRVAFYGCTFLGYQDTLYATIGLQYYKNCSTYFHPSPALPPCSCLFRLSAHASSHASHLFSRLPRLLRFPRQPPLPASHNPPVIQGRVDFVFGNAKALFHDCKFRLVYWGGGYFAQARDKGQDTGFVVLGGSLKPFGKGPIKPGYLARSWGDYSTVVFVNTMFAAGSVRAEGWGFVSGYEDTDSLTFGAYGCYGPGYNTTGWESFAKVMTAAEAAPYSSINYVNQGGWIVDPNALVRGVGGLVNNGNGKGGGRKKPAASPTPATTPSPKPVPTKPSSKPGPKPAPKTAPVPAPKTAPVPAPKTAPVPAPKASGSAPNKGTGNVPASSGGRGKKRGPVADGASGTPGGQTGGGKPVASVSPPAPKTNGNGRDRHKPAGVGGGSKKGNSSRGNGANGNKNKDDDGDDDDDN